MSLTCQYPVLSLQLLPHDNLGPTRAFQGGRHGEVQNLWQTDPGAQGVAGWTGGPEALLVEAS
ncbi:MAG: hypothetical protein ABR507_10105 [Actinomycetota bacterium]|nr:hypothetical protein [Actinomycetota bacterium]